MDKVEKSQYFGIECNSDNEINEDESDAEYFSDEGDGSRGVIDYDLDKMFDIVKKRDFHHWSLKTISNRYSKISDGDSGRQQISR